MQVQSIFTFALSLFVRKSRHHHYFSIYTELCDILNDVLP